jgi:hypothetical protein
MNYTNWKKHFRSELKEARRPAAPGRPAARSGLRPLGRRQRRPGAVALACAGSSDAGQRGSALRGAAALTGTGSEHSQV